MHDILISIRPEYVSKILDGTKRYEYRKVRCRQPVVRMFIYSTSSVMKVVAEAEIKEILTDDPGSIWERTSDYAGISRGFFDSYYEGRPKMIDTTQEIVDSSTVLRSGVHRLVFAVREVNRST